MLVASLKVQNYLKNPKLCEDLCLGFQSSEDSKNTNSTIVWGTIELLSYIWEAEFENKSDKIFISWDGNWNYTDSTSPYHKEKARKMSTLTHYFVLSYIPMKRWNKFITSREKRWKGNKMSYQSTSKHSMQDWKEIWHVNR